MAKQRCERKEPNRYLIFDSEGHLTVNGYLPDEVLEGENNLIETLEEIAEDCPDTINEYQVFKIEPVCFKVQVTEVSVTLDC